MSGFASLLAWLRGTASRLRRQEDGAVAVLVALSMVALMGFVGLVLDGGELYLNRTQLQKAVDAAALAGAQNITSATSCSPSCGGAALAYAQSNGLASSELTAGVSNTAPVSVSTGPCGSGSAGSCPAWTVSAQRTVALTFMPVLGISKGTVSASATAIASPAQGVSSQYLLPYAVWDGNSGQNLINSTVDYRDNGWAGDNVKPSPDTNPNWNAPGEDNSFKGYLHLPGGVCNTGGSSMTFTPGTYDDSKGGNANENACKDIINSLAAAGEPAIMPVIDSACKGTCPPPLSSCPGGDFCVHIKGFVAVQVSSVGSMGSAWTGTVIDWNTWNAIPGQQFQSGIPSLIVLKLWQ